MIGDVALVMGYEKLEGEVTYAGFDVKQYRQLGVCGTSDLPVRYVGLYERQDNCTTQNVEIYMRGQALELDPGDSKNGERTEIKMTTTTPITAWKSMVWCKLNLILSMALNALAIPMSQNKSVNYSAYKVEFTPLPFNCTRINS
jgi:P2 family phage contractile tail tube protein